MRPILKNLKERLLNEPAFFLSALGALAVVVADQVELPEWLAAVAVVLFGLATRAVVVPQRNVKPARTTTRRRT